MKPKSCVNLPWIKVRHESGWFLMAFPPPPLHIKIGIVIKTLIYIHFYWEMCEGANRVDSFLASLNITDLSSGKMGLQVNYLLDRGHMETNPHPYQPRRTKG